MFPRALSVLSLPTLTLAVAVAAAAPVSAPASAQSSTIRIEPRPYYGAVVTMEQGVRVWRPLPPTSHMIINPTGSPVNLSIADIRETVTSNNTFHGVPQASAGAQAQSGSPTHFFGRPGSFNGYRYNRPGRPGHGLGGHAR